MRMKKGKEKEDGEKAGVNVRGKGQGQDEAQGCGWCLGLGVDSEGKILEYLSWQMNCDTVTCVVSYCDFVTLNF